MDYDWRRDGQIIAHPEIIPIIVKDDEGYTPMAKRDPMKVPESMQALYDEITAISDAFCKEHLNAEYADLTRKMAATLAQASLAAGQWTRQFVGGRHTIHSRAGQLSI
jgi:hypothetical protein